MTVVTGFTLEVDGDPQAVRRLADAFFREYGEILEETSRRQADFWVGLEHRAVYAPALSPVTGKIHVRTIDPIPPPPVT